MSLNPIQSKIKDWRENPIQFAYEAFKFDPDEWQKDALEYIAGYSPRRRLGMKACTGPGKTAVLAIIGWHRLLCFADKGFHPKGAALSITADNLKDNLWPELAMLQQRNEFLKKQFTWTKQLIYANDHAEDWFLSFRSYAKDADQQAIGRSLSGLHGRYPFVLLDEVGDMPVAVGRSANQIFTGAPKDALIAAAGNPTSIDGLLYEISNRLRTQWFIITITADPDDPKRTPRVDIEHAREQIRLHGKDNPWIMATILGLFPPGGFNSLLSIEEVEAAMNRNYRPNDYNFAPKIIGVDVAREGDDKSVIFRRQGLMSFLPKEFRNAKSTDLAGWIAQIEDDWKADGTIVDGTGGYGSGVIDALSVMNRYAHDCQFAGEPNNKKFYNKRAEIWWDMAEWIKSGGALPDVRSIIPELTIPTYSYKGDRILIEPKDKIKERLGRSPDLADALAVTFAFHISPKEKQRQSARASKVEEWNPHDYL